MEYKLVYKDGSAKYFEITSGLPTLLCPSFNVDGFVYHIDEDAVKILHNKPLESTVNGIMTREKAEFFMEYDKVIQTIHPNGIILSSEDDSYVGYSALFMKPTKRGIRNLCFKKLLKSYTNLLIDNEYYDGLRVGTNDRGFYNMIHAVKGLFSHDLDSFTLNYDGDIAYCNRTELNISINTVLHAMIESAVNYDEDTENNSNSLKLEIFNRVSNESYTPRDFEREFCQYNNIDEYLIEHKVPIK